LVLDTEVAPPDATAHEIIRDFTLVLKSCRPCEN
jgi:hypothetical protein